MWNIIARVYVILDTVNLPTRHWNKHKTAFLRLDMPNSALDIITEYIINDRDMTTGIQLLNIVWNQHYADYYPADEGLFNVSKITKEHRPSRLCSDVIFLTLRRFSRLVFNKNVAKLFKSFFAQDFLKKYIKDKTSVKGKISFYLL